MDIEQNKTILTLFFPGEYRFSGKSKPVPYEKDLMKKERKNRGKEQIPLLVKIGSKEIKVIKDKNPECECDCDWFEATSVFMSCGLKVATPFSFHYNTIYPSFCVSLSKECLSKVQAIADAMSIFSEYKENNQELSIVNSDDSNDGNSEKPVWQIYSMPIAWIQSDDEPIPRAEKYGGGIIVFSQPVNEPEGTTSTAEYVILLCMILLSYSSDVIWKMKRQLSLNAKKPVTGTDLQKIHNDCALFENLYYHPNPCRSDSELELFEKMKCQLKLEKVSKQIANAKELLDYRNELNLSIKSASIDNTVFITGYIGVLFALLSFCNIYGTDIVDFSKPVTSGWCYVFLAGLICATFCFLVKIISIIRSCFESIKKCSLIIGFILLVIVCAIFYGLFADPIGVFKIAGR